MSDSNHLSHPYVRSLNDWHLELAMLRDLVNELLWQMEGEEWMKSAAHISCQRFTHLVDSCPFPKDNDLTPSP